MAMMFWLLFYLWGVYLCYRNGLDSFPDRYEGGRDHYEFVHGIVTATALLSWVGLICWWLYRQIPEEWRW